MINTTHCRWPFTGQNCNVTFAQHFGSVYQSLQVVYTVSAVAFFLTISYFFGRVVTQREKCCANDLQSYVHRMLLYVSLSFCIRAVDPLGFSNRYPQIINQLFVDSATCALYCIVASIIFQWFQVMRSLAEHGHTAEIRRGRKHVHGVAKWKHWKQFCVIYIWSSVMLCSTLQSTVSPTWIWRSIKLVMLSFICLFFILGGWYQGLRIYSYTTHHESDPDLDKSSQKSDLTLPYTDNPKSQQLARAHAKREKARAQRRKEMMNQRRKQINRVAQFLVLMTLLSGFVLGTQCSNAAAAARTRYDINSNPEPVPSTPWLIFWGGDGIQFIVCLVALFFFRPKERDSSGSGDSKTKQPEPDRKSPDRQHRHHHREKHPGGAVPTGSPGNGPQPGLGPGSPASGSAPSPGGPGSVPVIGGTTNAGRLDLADHHIVELQNMKPTPVPGSEDASRVDKKPEPLPLENNPLPVSSKKSPKSPRKASDFARYMVDHLETGVLTLNEKKINNSAGNMKLSSSEPNDDSPRLKMRLIHERPDGIGTTPMKDSPEEEKDPHLPRVQRTNSHSALSPLPRFGSGKLNLNSHEFDLVEGGLANDGAGTAGGGGGGGSTAGKFRSSDQNTTNRGAFRTTNTSSVIPDSIRKQSSPQITLPAFPGVPTHPAFQSSPSHSIVSKTRNSEI